MTADTDLYLIITYSKTVEFCSLFVHSAYRSLFSYTVSFLVSFLFHDLHETRQFAIIATVNTLQGKKHGKVKAL